MKIDVSTLHFLPHLPIHLLLMHLKRLKMHFILTIILRRCTKLTMSTLKLIKKIRELMCFQQCPQSIACLHRISTRVKTNSGKKTKKIKNEQPWTLAYIWVLQTMSSPLSFFFFLTNLFSL